MCSQKCVVVTNSCSYSALYREHISSFDKIATLAILSQQYHCKQAKISHSCYNGNMSICNGVLMKCYHFKL